MNEEEFRTAWISVETRKAQAMEAHNQKLADIAYELARIVVQIRRPR